MTAATVEVRGKVDGSPRLTATLNKGGRLKFTELRGNARLEWRRSDPKDPEPTIEKGAVLAGASVSEAAPAK
jgi:hypothetical protein